ncbi:3-phosphoshikimate 1-carboxyvinyltransferase, chloroplastic-like [Arachis duranensis]|uniref:3-phosphoshikimate 1-carboxyvinyltransferase, chloroplastic-like n=1 Tax=Arachis duranensis TaxID=130453 RepID=A0A9C6TCW6_ARADU|nr:3-phosphoshikimate 1-carboxyvinyltransferase, chloroplastic-like [Arachis duranensis]
MLTALLMTAPFALGDVEIEIIDKLIPVPYVDMTLKLMSALESMWSTVFPTKSPGNAFVEGDASSASYFLAGAAVTGGTITVVGCGTSSLQNHPAVVVPRLPAGLNLPGPGEFFQMFFFIPHSVKNPLIILFLF